MSQPRSEVLVAHDGPVLTITLNRPDVLNALDQATHEALAAALQPAGDPEVRAVILTGAGRGFCVGQDVSAFPTDADAVGDLLRRYFNPAVRTLRELPKPVIAAVNGPAAGAGLALALACDLRVASDAASLVPAFLGIGLVPDSGLTHTLPRLIGPAAAFDWLVSGRKIGADEALRMGLVDRVVAGAELEASAAGLAAEWAAKPTSAIGLTKQLIDRSASLSFDDQLEQEARAQAVAAASDDFAEGVAAFLEKRPPRFTGR